MAQVVLKQVAKVYDKKVRAVEDFELTIADGEFIVFVGPSGCGKSTTLRMIAGLEEVTEGTIEIDGRVVNDLHPKDRDIAMVFQNYALYPHMSVFKNMAFGLMLRKMPKPEIDQRVGEAAELLGIAELLDRKPKQLSGGQRQRVALGRAIVREPKVFLFDEPLSNLDAKLRVTTRAEIKKLHKRLKTTTIYVTHDQEEAMTLGDRIVVMSAGRGVGRVEQVDTPLHVYRRPVNRFVGAFLGKTPMNFVEGRLEDDGGGIVFAGEGGVRVPMLPSVADRLRPHTGRDLSLGWRPSAMAETPFPKLGEHQATIRLHTEVVEPLGKNIDVSCRAPSGKELLARVEARDDFPVDADIDFYLDLEHVHIFEPGEFGENLTHPAAEPALA
jgi:multiple sugar transport system ATP-binding protein